MENLRQLRRSKSMTQAEVASHLNVSQQAYAKYEQGLTEPDFETLKTLSNLFGCSVGYLLDVDGKPVADNPGIKSKSIFKPTTSLNDYERELLRIYNKLNIKNKNQLLSFAYKLEQDND